MTVQRQVLFWLAALGIFLLLFWFFSPVLLPFIAGMALAYALDPVADWFQRRGLSRLAATLTIVVLFIILFVLVLLALLPILINQLAGLIENLPSYVDRLQTLVVGALDSPFATRFGLDPVVLENSLDRFISQGAGWLTTLLGSLWSGGRALVDLLALLVVTPVVAFYMLYDWDRMVAKVDQWLPRRQAPVIRRLGAEMAVAINGFVRGQGLTCLILGLIYAIGLALVGLNFGLLIGIGAGLISFIPYVGTTLGFIVGMGVALVQFWPDWIFVGLTALVFVVGQFVEGNFLQPKLVGGRVGLHPVWLMFALVAFGYMFGFVGLLIAVPTSAAVAVLVRYGLHRYLQSPYYQDIEEPGRVTQPAMPPEPGPPPAPVRPMPRRSASSPAES